MPRVDPVNLQAWMGRISNAIENSFHCSTNLRKVAGSYDFDTGLSYVLGAVAEDVIGKTIRRNRYFRSINYLKIGAGDEDRTRNFQLGKLTLYH